MTNRQSEVLKYIVEKYIETAIPIGSVFMAKNSDFNRSGATFRNEMRALHDEGYITKHHTSSGRVPTENGYRYYVDKLMETELVDKNVLDNLAGIINTQVERKNKIKVTGKYLAEYTGLAVIVALHSDSIYYTGLTNLFRQPELQVVASLLDVSTMFDQCEEKISILGSSMSLGVVSIRLGEDNALGHGLGLAGMVLKQGEVFTIVGPLRMNYARAKSILNYLPNIL